VRIQRLFERIQKGKLHNVAFDDFCTLIEELGFRLDRIRGSHRVYLHPAVPKAFPLQPEKGKAKPYQIRQLLRILEEYNLPGEE